MKPDKNGSKKWYSRATELIGRDNVQKLRDEGISLRCSDELRELEKLCDEQARIIADANLPSLPTPQDA